MITWNVWTCEVTSSNAPGITIQSEATLPVNLCQFTVNLQTSTFNDTVSLSERTKIKASDRIFKKTHSLFATPLKRRMATAKSYFWAIIIHRCKQGLHSTYRCWFVRNVTSGYLSWHRILQHSALGMQTVDGAEMEVDSSTLPCMSRLTEQGWDQW